MRTLIHILPIAVAAVAATGCKREHGATGHVRFKDASMASQVKTEAGVLTSPRVLGRVVLERGLGNASFWGKSDEAALAKLTSMVSAHASGDLEIELFVRDTDPHRAIDICNVTLAEYLAYRVVLQQIKAGPSAGKDVQFHYDGDIKACAYR